MQTLLIKKPFSYTALFPFSAIFSLPSQSSSRFSFLSKPYAVLALLLWVGLTISSPIYAQVAVVELAQAEQALRKADQSDADQYASNAIELARRTLSSAQAATLEKKTQKLAPILALKAAAEADLARVLSDKSKLQGEVQQRNKQVSELKSQLGAK